VFEDVFLVLDFDFDLVFFRFFCDFPFYFPTLLLLSRSADLTEYTALIALALF